jgi:predicted acyl esterase
VGYTTDTVPQRYMVDDQRFASYRPDVLVYETEPLEEDVTIAGPISPKLKVASSGTDSDFDVKLIDVYPEDYTDPDDSISGNKRILDAPPLHMGGYEEMLRGEPFRAKFRNSWEKPEALTPGKETAIDFTMPDLFHTFRRGHRIMVQVESSWFPLTDRNPQTFTDIPFAGPADFQKATEQVFHQKDAASGVEVLQSIVFFHPFRSPRRRRIKVGAPGDGTISRVSAAAPHGELASQLDLRLIH